MLRVFSEKPIRLPHLRPYVPNPNDPAIFWFNGERDDIVREVVDRAIALHGRDRRQLELTLNELSFHEVRRLAAQKDGEADAHLSEWRGLVRRIARMTDEEKRGTLRSIATRYAIDVAGNFDPRVYRFARRVIPVLLSGVMQPSALPRDLLDPSESYIDRLLTIEGEIDHLRRLAPKGTLVFVPTHSSNLDSIVLAQALEKSGLPPVVYGAGKNLFTNPIISFFMHNLGAYRVDRRIRANFYKEVLKSYSSVMIERGYHSLFFPGGTRSRSGMIERRLKLGLAGSGIEAFSRNQVRGVRRPVWFVPTTINYELVLEAETLIEDWLSEEGKSRYIIEDDEFSRVDRWVAFFRKLVGLEAACVIRFGRPVDPFGNDVDLEGFSRTKKGRAIESASYVSRRGRPSIDPGRDAAYTRELGELLVERYRRESLIMSTHVVAHALFRRLVRNSPGLDLFGRLRLRGEVSMTRSELTGEIGVLVARLNSLEQAGTLRLSPFVRSMTPEQILERALRVWSGYHRRVAARDLGHIVVGEDPTLLLYYQNRLVPFAEALAGDQDIAAAREIEAMGVWR